MNITSLALLGLRGWPDLDLAPLSPGLNAIVGPPGCGKSTLAEFVSHVLYGKLPANRSPQEWPDGEAAVECAAARYRLRRHNDGTRLGRLTVASPDGESVDSETVRRFVGDVSRDVLERYYAVNFRTVPPVDGAQAAEFVRAFHDALGEHGDSSPRIGELAARRDSLAQELERRIAAERRLSTDLEQRRRDLERQIRESEQSESAIELRLRAVESALSETDARLRYRRLELNAELRWQISDAAEWKPELAELDDEITRRRTMLSELAQREAAVRSRLAHVSPGVGTAGALVDQQSWLAVARQLAADLDGEVARLARASSSQQCVCSDAHPRFRPIVETFRRQLDRLETMLQSQQRASLVADLAAEAEGLSRAQSELRAQIDHLLNRRQSLMELHCPSRRTEMPGAERSDDAQPAGSRLFSAADAEQLEQRRLELEQQRFELMQSLRAKRQTARTLRGQRAELDRQRAALLSARSIEHVQRELTAVQRKLEESIGVGCDTADDACEGAWRASDFLAQLTDGRIVRLEYSAADDLIAAIRDSGARAPLASLSPAEHALVRLSFSLAIVAALARRDVRLPLILDEPFEQLSGRATAALASVLDAFAKDGHQVLVFTSQPAAIERLASLGACQFDLVSLRRWRCEAAATESNRSIGYPSGRQDNQQGTVDNEVVTTAHFEELPASNRRTKRGLSIQKSGRRQRKRGDAA